jgi:hypothetical protein
MNTTGSYQAPNCNCRDGTDSLDTHLQRLRTFSEDGNPPHCATRGAYFTVELITECARKQHLTPVYSRRLLLPLLFERWLILQKLLIFIASCDVLHFRVTLALLLMKRHF